MKNEEYSLFCLQMPNEELRIFFIGHFGPWR
jgi:hypothetical protein